MSGCEVVRVTWKGRRAWRLSNGVIEITVLVGGGHIADLRVAGSPYNLIFESPWPTIEPYEFSPRLHASKYGDGAVGRLLSGYSGHALALGYFGMPSAEEAAQGLPLHGEAVAAEWQVLESSGDDRQASLTLQALLPVYQLLFERRLRISDGASTVRVEERVTNIGPHPRDHQWVQHAAFGEPLFSAGESSLSLSAKRGLTWPLGYEGWEALAANRTFQWPLAPSTDGGALDLSLPFQRNGTGFVASLLCDYPSRSSGFIAVHNHRLALAAGYVFDCRRFPWIALWEENRARRYPPWNGIARVRGVEFGTSPMPLGLEQAKQTGELFDMPVFTTLAAGANSTTSYQIFATTPSGWPSVEDVVDNGPFLALHGPDEQQLEIPASRAD
jgi:hypothetical protein